MITRRIKPRRIYREIDWTLLVLFAGLFVVVAGLERTALLRQLLADAAGWRLDRVPVLSAITLVLSNLVSNVPAVLVLKPFVQQLAQPAEAWRVVAMASTFAGNLTLAGSVANLIVAERAARSGIRISFSEYLRTGAPLTLLTIAMGVAWLM